MAVKFVAILDDAPTNERENYYLPFVNSKIFFKNRSVVFYFLQKL